VIRLPERSVTRFFIPLIDVLLLLFCIYLLMPLAEGTEGKAEPNHPLAVMDEARKARLDLARLRQEKEEAGKKLALLRSEEKHLLHQRLAIKVLEIDPRNGKLYTFDERGKRLDIASAQDAERLIKQHREEIGGRELYYLFLFPRQDTGYPEQGQFEQYERWFATVPHGLDNPLGGGR
jgi:hypothetical protein